MVFQNVDQRLKDLAIMLNPYARGGHYERFFEGRNNVDFSNDFIVIENEELKQQLGDIGADDPVKAAVIEEAARRAR